MLDEIREPTVHKYLADCSKLPQTLSNSLISLTLLSLDHPLSSLISDRINHYDQGDSSLLSPVMAFHCEWSMVEP